MSLNRLSRAIAASPAMSDLNRLSRAIAASPAMSDLNRLSQAIEASIETHATEAKRARRTIADDSTLLELRPNSKAIVASVVATNENSVRPLSADRSLKSISRARPSRSRLLFKLDVALHFDLAPVPQAIESNDPDASSDPLHWMVLCEVERRLRNVVREHLTRLVGSNWVKQRVPQDVRKRWHDRQAEDRAADRPVYDAIEYADFMDLRGIITRRDNWRDAFSAIFRDQDEIGVSLRRLHPVRKALAHSRPLSQTDVLTLASETSWILSRLRIRALH